ncbi:MAG: FAD-binding oxidoreductase [Gammaproteobacteria bacterium]|nr:FAD-binding oxidoreductase [Gammaproteobacteria bacterium]
MTSNISDTSRKVTVIGAGIVGISCALHLQQRGYDITIIDRLPPGEATSFGNAGVIATGAVVPVATPGIIKKVPSMLLDPLGPLSIRWSYLPRLMPWLRSFVRNSSPQKVEKISDALSQLLSASVEEHQLLTAGTGAEKWVRPAPYTYIYKDEQSFDKDAYVWKLRSDRGVKTQILRGGEVQEYEPALSSHYKLAVQLHDHGYILDPSQLIKTLAQHFQTAGGKLLRTKVRDFEIGPNGPERLLTDTSPLEVDVLVIAAGAWSAELATKLGSTIPLESERGYHITIDNSGVSLRGPIMSAAEKVVATPMTPGLRLAGLVEFGGLSAPPNYKRTRTLLKHAKRLFSGVNTAEFTEWMGHRPSLPDSLPVVAKSPVYPSVYYAFGHQHVGMTSGPKTGRLIAALVAGESPNIDLAPFKADRF